VLDSRALTVPNEYNAADGFLDDVGHAFERKGFFLQEFRKCGEQLIIRCRKTMQTHGPHSSMTGGCLLDINFQFLLCMTHFAL